MRLTERDKLVLTESFTGLLWLGMLGWAWSYSYWLGMAFGVYIHLDRTVLRKYREPEILRGEGA